MKIAIIGTVGIPAKYGGFETLAEYLVKELNKNYEFTVYCSAPQYGKERKKTHLGARLKFLPLSANGSSSIIYDVWSIFHAFFYADTLLVLGVSGAFMIPFVRLFSRKKIITNIDGLEWKRDKWNGFAKWYLKLQEKIAVRSSHFTVVDNQGIAEHVKNSYGKNSVLIAYGADHVSHEPVNIASRKALNIPDKYAFKVCRIEPENNIHIILEAFSKTLLNIVIVGNWENSDYGKNLKKKFGDFQNIFIVNPIYDQQKLNELRSNCHLYIHGHSAGGTNPSLVEAMYLGLPIIAFDVNYNRFTTGNKAIYFKDAQEMEVLLNKIENDERQQKLIAESMKELAYKHYTWKIISQKYSALFSA
ncbi:DUF1972 domain-containing protein [Aurantibacter crassamenti]|uniref:DUF1972 domain-containing protein n=1 Tax=Aurantibacter crassamenti TaxID=1837375 RepID=UPI001EEDBED6|nr:DUF1972 domain-containing protein [Aurantibacter crassamenti]